ncbi:hypothetical protein KBC79_00045 [Candidatus Woesebacteria bacterium]|nr:hypothetical protein [Candidatus Woesebacteria bacterium]
MIEPPKLNKLQQIVLAVENISLLSPFDGELKLSVGSNDLESITYEELLTGLQRLEDEQEVIKLSRQDSSTGDIYFFVTNPHGVDFWAKEIRDYKDRIPGEIKSWRGLQIGMERAWLKFAGEKIAINLSNKYIRFLIELIDVKGAIITYANLSMRLDLSSANDETTSAPNDLKTFKQDLQKYLVQAGLTKESALAIKNMIQSVRSTGYQLT